MRTSEQIGALTKALVAAQADMKNAPLNKVNPHFKSKYADFSAVRDATLPHLTKHKLAIWQGTEMDDGGRLSLHTRLAHESGEWIESSYPLPVDLSKPQAMGSALSYARRYSWASICGIAAEEDDDANAAQDAGKGQTQQRQQPKREATPFDESQVDTDRRMANQLRSQITATRTFDELDRVKKSPDFTATYRSLPDELQKEIVGLGAEHREFIASLAAEQKEVA